MRTEAAVADERDSDMDILQRIHGQLDDYLGKVRWQSKFADIDDGAIESHALVPVQQVSLLPGDLQIPFSNFATANVVPGPHDVRLIDSIIYDRNAQISELALQMTHVDAAIRKLAAIRVKLEENTAHARASLLAHQALTSPARQIPPEILGEVFYHCLPRIPYITPRDVECPMVLTSVCHHWHAVAMSTPRLWSSLSLSLSHTTDERYRRGCESWLARAKSVPLTIRVVNDIMLAADPTQIATIVHWLRPLVAQSSDLWWHGPSIYTLFVPDPGSDLPLERLRITTHRDAPAVHVPATTKHLRAASLECLNYDLQSLDAIDLPWDALVSLDMHFALFGSTLFIQLLARCASLRSLVVSCLWADDVQRAALRALPRGSIMHPALRRLEIKVIRAGFSLILDALTLPALEELDVCFCFRERDAWPHAAFMEMIGRSRCKLKRLTVRSNKTAAPHFEEYLEAMPGLAISTCVPDRLLR